MLCVIIDNPLSINLFDYVSLYGVLDSGMLLMKAVFEHNMKTVD